MNFAPKEFLNRTPADNPFMERILKNLVMVGVSHKTLDIEGRSELIVSLESVQRDLGLACPSGIVVLSTCNRIEVYAITPNSQILQGLLSAPARAKVTLIGHTALHHLLRVTSGLESQLIGDTEIAGQVRRAYAHSRAQGYAVGGMDRVFDLALRVSKEVKNNSRLSSGVTSYSYAAVRAIKEKRGNDPFSVALVGTGEIGESTLQNLRKYLPQAAVHLFNRSFERSRSLARDLGALAHPMEDLALAMSTSDVAIFASKCPHYIIGLGKFSKIPKLIIDLGSPLNVDPQIGMEHSVELLNIDDLKKTIEKTSTQRLVEIGKAEEIIFRNLIGITRPPEKYRNKQLAA